VNPVATAGSFLKRFFKGAASGINEMGIPLVNGGEGLQEKAGCLLSGELARENDGWGIGRDTEFLPPGGCVHFCIRRRFGKSTVIDGMRDPPELLVRQPVGFEVSPVV
jgi:hypothetical protein